MFGKIVLDILLVVIYGVGLLILFGIINELFIRLFTKILGEGALKVQIVTGAIGTPVHEAGHALFCLIFGHKITQIKLYDPSPENGVMGYVNHTYNPKNFYHVIGNFFIGVGPLILGSLVLIALFAMFAGESFQNIAEMVSIRASEQASLGALFGAIGDVFAEVFSLKNISSVLWWIFFIIACPVALHMNLSISDIKDGWQGLLFTIGVLVVVSLIVGLCSFEALQTLTQAMFAYALYQIMFASLALIAFVLMLVVAVFARVIKSRVRHY